MKTNELEQIIDEAFEAKQNISDKSDKKISIFAAPIIMNDTATPAKISLPALVASAMQENALHGWRLRDKTNLAMTGYPTKVKSFSWAGSTPHLVTSGSNKAICWPFDGKDGPMGRKPLCVATSSSLIATCVCALPREDALVAGFRDGTVRLAELNESKETILV